MRVIGKGQEVRGWKAPRLKILGAGARRVPRSWCLHTRTAMYTCTYTYMYTSRLRYPRGTGDKFHSFVTRTSGWHVMGWYHGNRSCSVDRCVRTDVIAKLRQRHVSLTADGDIAYRLTLTTRRCRAGGRQQGGRGNYVRPVRHAH